MMGDKEAVRGGIQFRVDYEFTLNGETHRGIEEEASWFLVDQQGKMWSYGPMMPVRPLEPEYSRATVLIGINGEWLSVAQIEALLKKEVE